MNLITHTYKNLNKGSENCFLKYNFNTEETRKIQHVKLKELEHCWPPCSSFFSKYLEWHSESHYSLCLICKQIWKFFSYEYENIFLLFANRWSGIEFDYAFLLTWKHCKNYLL